MTGDNTASDSGTQLPDGIVVILIAAAWSLFQLSIASWLTLNSDYIRSIHLAFALLLCFMTRPAFKRKVGNRRVADIRRRWGRTINISLAVVASVVALVFLVDYDGISSRYGAPILRDVVVGLLLLGLLLEACRRTVGPALSIIALCFCAYAFFGPYMPDVLAFKGVSLSRFIGQMTMSTEGIYGVPLRVSATIVFLFVLFGSMLERAGGGQFFTELSLSLLGRFKGGPAKAAVLSSGLTGMVSGSSIANIVTTGTFTIPLMKKVGYPPTKAAAIEVAASTDGQLAPPIMGAAAFIIAEYVNVPYLHVVKAAAIPAFASYAALLFITHIEAGKLGLKGMPRADLPRFGRVMARGAHYMIPLLFLLYELIIKRRSAERAAFFAVCVMACIMVSQHTIRALFCRGPVRGTIRRGFRELLESLAAGAVNMIPVALATAGAGIIVGVVSLGLGGIITGAVYALSGGSMLLMLVITAAAALVIGMGLPTTATYITMASSLAPVIVAIGATEGIVVPLMAAHLFCFYFGILADDTPPVGLAAYAAAAIARAPPIATGVQGFLYDIRTAILPFIFMFNSELILHDVSGWGQGLFIFGLACAGTCTFAAATQGWLICRNRFYEVPVLLVAALLLFLPGRVAEWVHVPHASRYWMCVPGFVLIGLVVLAQSRRARVAGVSAGRS